MEMTCDDSSYDRMTFLWVSAAAAAGGVAAGHLSDVHCCFFVSSTSPAASWHNLASTAVDDSIVVTVAVSNFYDDQASKTR